MNIVTPREVEYLPSQLRARKNLLLQLTKRQTQILIGSVLGDGYITPRGQIQLEHSAKSKAYLLWKFRELKGIAYGKFSKAHRKDWRTGKTHQSYRFWTRQFFRPWREYFYHRKMKIFPKELVLDRLALATWYMDDGCYSDHRCTIAVENFPKSSQQRIVKALKKQFQIDAFIRSNGKLAIRAQCIKRFFTLIRPYIYRSMAYKLGLKLRQDSQIK